MMQKDNAVVVDFDGTLVSANSFEAFLKWVLSMAIKEFFLWTLFNLLIVIIYRKLRLISHKELKRRTMLLYEQSKLPNRLDKFIGVLVRYVNGDVIKLVSDYRERGHFVVVSTAAPRFYVERLFDRISFHADELIATEFPVDDKWVENIREVKKEQTLKVLGDKDMRLSVLITDHYDDFPLLQFYKDLNILVSPSQKTKAMLNHNGVEYIEMSKK